MQLLNFHQGWVIVSACVAAYPLSCLTAEDQPWTQCRGDSTHHPTATLTDHITSPPESTTALEQKQSLLALVQICGRLEVHLFTGLPFSCDLSLCTKGEQSSVPTATGKHAEEVSACCFCEQPPHSPPKGLFVAITLLQTGKCQFPLCQD